MANDNAQQYFRNAVRKSNLDACCKAIMNDYLTSSCWGSDTWEIKLTAGMIAANTGWSVRSVAGRMMLLRVAGWLKFIRDDGTYVYYHVCVGEDITDEHRHKAELLTKEVNARRTGKQALQEVQSPSATGAEQLCNSDRAALQEVQTSNSSNIFHTDNRGTSADATVLLQDSSVKEAKKDMREEKQEEVPPEEPVPAAGADEDEEFAQWLLAQKPSSYTTSCFTEKELQEIGDW